MEYLTGFIKGSYSVDLAGAFASWLGKLAKASDKFVIVCPKEKEYESIVRMARIGFDNCSGYLEGGMEAWKAAKQEIFTGTSIDAEHFEKFYMENLEKKNFLLLDCRDTNEKWKGYLEFS